MELTPLGTGLHWEALDADLSVAGLAAGIFGSKAWMSELARYAGSRTSARKASSSRLNGKRGVGLAFERCLNRRDSLGNISVNSAVNVPVQIRRLFGREEARLGSPRWHEVALREGAARHDAGKAQPMDCDAAKRELSICSRFNGLLCSPFSTAKFRGLWGWNHDQFCGICPCV